MKLIHKKDLPPKIKKKVYEDNLISNNNNSVKKKKALNNNVNKKDIKIKENIVTSFLKRWWYAIDDWYKQDRDINEILKENKLRQVTISNWKLEKDTDKDGN